MTDLEFFFDPVCPWAWITSRWVVEVQSLRSYEVRWRFISLKLINATNTADWYGDQYKRWPAMGHEALRVSVAMISLQVVSHSFLKLWQWRIFLKPKLSL